MYLNTRGLVLREVTYKETSKILTVLTAEQGCLTVSAKGVRRRGSKLAPGAQLLTFSEMTLSGSRDRWTLTEAMPIEMFEGLRSDLTRLALGSYFAQLLEAVSNADQPSPAILSLGLNALYLLSEGSMEESLVKSAFEMRLMALSGFMPALEACRVCGNPEPVDPRLEIRGGTVRCRDCRDETDFSESVPLCAGSLAAMRHTISCADKKVFAFTLGQNAARRLETAAEKYVLAQLDRGFSTLDYYKKCR